MIKCYRNRWTCHACGNTFKLKSYLEKHKRTQHQAWASINRTLKRSAGHFKVGLKTNSHEAKVNVDEEKHNLDDQSKVKGSKEKHVSDCQGQKKEETVGTAKKVESVDLVSEEHSDWDKSPDVSLEGELQVSDDSDSSIDNDSRRQEIKKDKVNQSSVDKEKELWLGRVIRKATTPAIPVAPKKQKVDEKPENEDIGQKEIVIEVKQDNGTLRRKKEIKVTCESMIKEGSSESVTTVTENGEETYRDRVQRKKQKTGPVKIDMGDIVPDGSIRASDISLQLKGEGNVELTLTYCPESDD